ncbi:MAG: diguanylate cyclase [Pseudomonadota bacterium]
MLLFSFRHPCLRVLALGAAMLLSAPPAAALQRTLRFENLAASHVKTPSSAVSALAQDSQGFIWIGTQNGVYRHDGQRSLIFHHEPGDPRSLPGDYVGALLNDAHGRLWLGTNGGLARFDPETESFTRFAPAPGVAGELVGSIADDGKDGLWLGTRHGLNHVDSASGRFLRHVHDPARATSLASDQVGALARDAHGGLWLSVGTAGLDYLAPGSAVFEHFDLNQGPGPRVASVSALQFDASEQLWIGTDRGIVLWRPGSAWASRAALPGPDGPAPYSVFGIHLGPDATVWVGTQGAGLLQWDARTRQFARYRHQQGDLHSLPSDHVYSMLVDRSATLWVGTWGAGLARTDLGSEGLERFIPEAEQGRSADNVIVTLSRAGGGRIWLGGPGGLRLYDRASGKVVRSWRHDPARRGSLPSTYVQAVLQQGAGPVWVGGPSGLSRLDRPDGPFASVPLARATAVQKIVAGRGGMLWLCTDGGVLRFDPRRTTATPVAYDPAGVDGAARAAVSVMLEDRKGRLWIGNPHGDGLDVQDPASGKFVRYRHDERVAGSLSNNFVRSLYQDRQGRVWVGTLKGLNEAVEGEDGRLHFRAPALEGLASVYIESIEGDASGRLWAAGATASGEAALIRIDPASGAGQYYHASDGISGGDFYDGAALLDADGSLVFGSTQGFTTVRPDALRSNTLAPQVALVDLAVANRSLRTMPRPASVLLEGPVGAPRHLTLAWDQASFSVEFAAMHFADPERNRYAYRLDGVDSGWIGTDAAHRTASYTKLAPGQYLLRIKAANNNGLWGEPGMTLAITVPPPFWATWWWRTLVTLALLGALALAYRWRLARLRRNERRLAGLVQLRTDELQRALLEQQAILDNALTGIAFQRRRVIERCNVSFERILGYAAGELAGQPLRILFFSDLEYERRWRRLERQLAGGAQAVGARQFRRKDGGAVWCSLNIKLIDERKAGGGMVVVLQDITARKQAERALRLANRSLTELSIGDSLTGIANRRRFDQVAASEWQRAQRQHEWLALALVDIDHFKDYNDQFGHLAGDVCLRSVALALQDGLRRGGDFVARYGGEEFVVILYGQDLEQAALVLEQLRHKVEALALRHADSAAGAVITFSAGLAAMVAHQDASLAELLELADQNLYQAKRQGRNQVCAAAR